MGHDKNRIPYRIDRRLTGLAEPDYDATISFGLPIEPEDSQYGKYRSRRPVAIAKGRCSQVTHRPIPSESRRYRMSWEL